MPSQLFLFRPSEIELKLYRKFRADQAHNPTKLDHYPINIKGVMTIRVRVGPTGWTHAVPTVFFRPSAIELKLYRKFRADKAHNPTKLDLGGIVRLISTKLPIKFQLDC